MTSRSKITIVTIIMLSLFGYLMFIGLKEGSMYYLEVAEFTAKADSLGNEKVRVNGEIVPNSVKYDLETQTLTFTMKDTKGPERLNVMYRGVPPDLLEDEGVTVVAEGRYVALSNTFASDKLLVKCPSKYEKKEPKA